MSDPYSSPTQNNEIPLSQAAADTVKQLRIITFALLSGVMVFAGVTLVMNGFRFGEDPDILSWIGLGFAGVMIVNSFVIPPVMAKTQINAIAAKPDGSRDAADRTEQLLGVYRSQTIVGCALLEGAAFFNLVATIVTPFIGNVVAVAVLMGLMLSRVPSATRLQHWVQDRTQEMTVL